MEYQIKIEDIGAQRVAAVVEKVPISEVGAFIGEAFRLVMAALKEQQLAPSGPPFARYQMLGDTFEVTAGFPTEGRVEATGRVVSAELPGGSVATTAHIGAYDHVNLAYDAIMAWLPTQGMQASGDTWEVYLDGPEVAEPRTIVRVPCRPVG